MPLPHFTNQQAALISDDPVYLSLFEIEFESQYISSEESKYLMEQCFYIKSNRLKFNVNDDFKITKILLKMKTFNMIVKTHNKMDKVTSIYYLIDCSFNNLEKSILDFNWNSTGVLTYHLEYENKEFDFLNFNDNINFDDWKKNHMRKQKIKNILK